MSTLTQKLAVAVVAAGLLPLAAALPAQAATECNPTRSYLNSSHTVWYEECTEHPAVGKWIQQTRIFNNHGANLNLDSDFKLTIDGVDHNFPIWYNVTAYGIPNSQGINTVNSYLQIDNYYDDAIPKNCTAGHQYKPWVRMRLHATSTKPAGAWGPWSSIGQFRC